MPLQRTLSTGSNAPLREYDRVIIGIDPGTNIMGYGILGIKGKQPLMIAMGLIELSKFDNHYMRLQYLPDEMAIEAPFFGKNVQSMLKLGRAQGVAMAAALSRDVPITEYEPRKIKQVITGNGAASKEQVCEMLRRMLDIPRENLLPKLDATDALAAALCHYYESQKPVKTTSCKSWKDFIAKNPGKVTGL